MKMHGYLGEMFEVPAEVSFEEVEDIMDEYALNHCHCAFCPYHQVCAQQELFYGCHLYEEMQEEDL